MFQHKNVKYLNIVFLGLILLTILERQGTEALVHNALGLKLYRRYET